MWPFPLLEKMRVDSNPRRPLEIPPSVAICGRVKFPQARRQERVGLLHVSGDRQTWETRIVRLLNRCASCRFAIVKVEHPTESLLPADHPNSLYRARHCPDQPIVQPLMISLPVVKAHIFGHRATQRHLPDEDHPIRAFELDRANKSLRVCIQVR